MTTTQTNPVTSGTSRSLILSLSAIALLLTFALVKLVTAINAQDLLILESAQSSRINRVASAASLPEVIYKTGDVTPVTLKVEGVGTLSCDTLKLGTGVVGDTLEFRIKPASGWGFAGWRGSHFQDQPPFFSELNYKLKGGDVLIAVFEPLK